MIRGYVETPEYSADAGTVQENIFAVCILIYTAYAVAYQVLTRVVSPGRKTAGQYFAIVTQSARQKQTIENSYNCNLRSPRLNLIGHGTNAGRLYDQIDTNYFRSRAGWAL